MRQEQSPVAVLGAGSWGTALAILLAGNGQPVRLWVRNPEHAADFRGQRSNPRYLPGVAFPPPLRVTSSLEEAVADAPDILVAVPSHAFREVLERLVPRLHPRQRIAWATKGLEPGTGQLLDRVAADVLGADLPTAVVSGPTFAAEVAAGLPTAITVASASTAFAAELAQRLHNDRFRVYVSGDVTGVGLGGSIKNVLAVAAGIADGLGFGANTRAALITRGLAEMMRLGERMGGCRETFIGLAGLGDLVLTCTDDKSRNRRMGLALARGESPRQAQIRIGQVVEGVGTAREVVRLAQRYGVEMPISDQVFRVLHEGLSARAAVDALLSREDVRAERI